MKKKPTVLMILDGYGLNENCDHNAVCEGKTPVMDQMCIRDSSSALPFRIMVFKISSSTSANFS